MIKEEMQSDADLLWNNLSSPYQEAINKASEVLNLERNQILLFLIHRGMDGIIDVGSMTDELDRFNRLVICGDMTPKEYKELYG